MSCDPTLAEKQALSQHYWICWGEQKAYKGSYLWDLEVEENAESNPKLIHHASDVSGIHYPAVQEDILNICVNTKSRWNCVRYWLMMSVRKYVRESKVKTVCDPFFNIFLRSLWSKNCVYWSAAIWKNNKVILARELKHINTAFLIHWF